MIVLLLSPEATVAEGALGAAPGVVTHVVCWADAAGPDLPGAIAVPRPTGVRGGLNRRLWPLLRRSVVGRTLFRASPLDHGALFWMAVSRAAAVTDAARGADVIVAGERDGAYAAWKLSRLSGRPAGASAYASVAAGRADLERRQA